MNCKLILKHNACTKFFFRRNALKLSSQALITALLLYSPVAVAQKKARSSGSENWILAQQAFTRLDYTNAYKYASETLKREPQNHEARRIASKAAKELERYSDCLRIMGGLPVTSVTADDVNLVGECSSASSYTPWTLNFLKQNSGIVANRDMANFWLGRYHYKRSEYTRAQQLLSPIVVLPARLEKDRLFMLSRIKEVLKASETAAPAAVPTAVATQTPFFQPTPVPIVILPVPPPYVPYQPPPPPMPRPHTEALNTAPEEPSNFLSGINFYARGILYSSQGIEMPLDPDSGEARSYDELAQGDGSNLDINDVKITEPENAQIGEFSTIGYLGYRFGDASSFFSDLTLNAGLGLTARNYRENVKAVFYTLPGDFREPHVFLYGEERGFGMFVEPSLMLHFTKDYGIGGFARFAKNFPDFKSKGISLEQKFGGRGVANYEMFHAQAGLTYTRFLESDGIEVFSGSDYWADFSTDKIWYLSLRAPKDTPLFRYSFRTQKDVLTKYAVEYTTSDGTFLALNIVPRFHFQNAINAFAWLRYAKGYNRKFVSPSLNAQVKSVPMASAFRETALYNTTLNEWIGGVEWPFQNKLTVTGGLSFRNFTGSYVDGGTDPRDNKPQRFQALLSRPLVSRTLFFLDVVVAL